MKNIIFSLLFITLFSCISKENDIYSIIPKGTLITTDLIRKSEGIYKCKLGTVLMYNLTNSSSEYYNPHLLFFDINNRLLSSTYFCSEDIYSLNNNEFTAYLNEYRRDRINSFRNEIPEGINIKYKNYSPSEFVSTNIDVDTITRIKLNSKDETVNLVLKNNVEISDKYKNIPLCKITYNYKKGNFFINNTFNNSVRNTEVFVLKQNILDDFFNQLIVL